MKKVFALLSLLLVSACCTDAFAADEFGSRFGNSSPYALGNTMGKASDNVNGMGLDDLNTIAPAAGDEQDVVTPEEDIEKTSDEIEEITPTPATPQQ